MVKGKEVDLLPDRVQAGVYMHRAIDRFTDQHAEVRALNQLISSRHGRYASVLTDIGFDYFLYLNWDCFGPEPFATFCAATYHRIQRQRPHMPARAAVYAERMVVGRWLNLYADLAGMREVFHRLRRRLSKPHLLDGVEDLLVDFHDPFNRAFLALFPELQTLANGYRPEGTSVSRP